MLSWKSNPPFARLYHSKDLDNNLFIDYNLYATFVEDYKRQGGNEDISHYPRKTVDDICQELKNEKGVPLGRQTYYDWLKEDAEELKYMRNITREPWPNFAGYLVAHNHRWKRKCVDYLKRDKQITVLTANRKRLIERTLKREANLRRKGGDEK